MPPRSWTLDRLSYSDTVNSERVHGTGGGPGRARRRAWPAGLPSCIESGSAAEYATDVARIRQRGVLLQDRVLEVPQVAAGLQAELIAQQFACLAVRGERVGLAAGAVERQHQLGAQPLPQRMLWDERLELGAEGDVSADRELRVDPVLEGS
jgi:hypothetical protein